MNPVFSVLPREADFKVPVRVLLAMVLLWSLVGCLGDAGSSGEEEQEAAEPGDVVVEITLAEFVEPGAESTLTVRAGVARSDGSVDYSPVIDIDLAITNGSSSRPFGVVDEDGFFVSDVTLTAGFDLLIVFATATTVDGETATATEQARAVTPGLPIVVESRVSAVAAEAEASAGGTGSTDRPDSVRTDSNFFGSFEEDNAASIEDVDFAGSASSTASTTQDSILVSDGEGGSFSGGSATGTCNASATTSVTPPFSQDLLIALASGSSGIDLTFRIDGDEDYLFALDGTFSGTVGGSGTPSGRYRLFDTAGCDTVCEGVNYNPDEDGAALTLSERVTLPAGGRYRLELGFDCTAVAFRATTTAETESTMGFTFSLTPLDE